MTYKPPVKKASVIRGRAEFKLTKDGKVAQFTLNYKDGKNQESMVRRISVGDLPDTIQAGLKAGIKNLWITVNAEGDKVFSGYPLNGIVTAKFGGIPHREGEVPSYKTNIGKFGEFRSWVALHEVTEGPFEGEKITHFLPYNFDGVTVDGERVTAYSKDLEKSKPTAELHRVMEVTGVWEKGSIKWKDTDGDLYNILPKLEARALEQAKAGAKYQLVLEDGNIVNIIPLSSGLFDDVAEDDGDEFEDSADEFEDDPEPETLKPDAVAEDEDDEDGFWSTAE